MDCDLIRSEDNIPASVGDWYSSDDEQVLDDLDPGVFYLHRRSFVTLRRQRFINTQKSDGKEM